jgi:hypothetical protein
MSGLESEYRALEKEIVALTKKHDWSAALAASEKIIHFLQQEEAQLSAGTNRLRVMQSRRHVIISFS